MKWKTKVLVRLLAVALLLSGCGRNDVPIVTTEYNSSLTYGVFEADKLEVLPWDSGRSESTTAHKVAEVENGYYFLYNLYLYYADKTDLTNRTRTFTLLY